MASSEIIVKQEIRPCYVNEKKALFHGFLQYSRIISPSFAVGGHSGGNIFIPCAIVEYEDGNVETIEANLVKFCDSKGLFKEYYFNERETTDEKTETNT